MQSSEKKTEDQVKKVESAPALKIERFFELWVWFCTAERKRDFSSDTKNHAFAAAYFKWLYQVAWSNWFQVKTNDETLKFYRVCDGLREQRSSFSLMLSSSGGFSWVYRGYEFNSFTGVCAVSKEQEKQNDSWLTNFRKVLTTAGEEEQLFTDVFNAIEYGAEKADRKSYRCLLIALLGELFGIDCLKMGPNLLKKGYVDKNLLPKLLDTCRLLSTALKNDPGLISKLRAELHLIPRPDEAVKRFCERVNQVFAPSALAQSSTLVLDVTTGKQLHTTVRPLTEKEQQALAERSPLNFDSSYS